MCTKLMRSCLVVLVFAVLSAQSFAGNNPVVKVAVHVEPHGTGTCESVPDIRVCGDIRYTYPGCGEVDVFPVFWGMTEYLGFEYSLIWPAEWGTCSFTSCSDLHIYTDFFGDPDLFDPGDVVAHAYFACRTGDYVEIPGFAWLTASTAGKVCIDGRPPWDTNGWHLPAVLDCHENVDETVCMYCAGVCGMIGDEPCELPSSVEVTEWGKIKAMFK